MIWQAWVNDYGYTKETGTTSLTPQEAGQNNNPLAQTTTPFLEIEKSSAPDVESFDETEKREKISVTTDVLDIVIDTAGGTIEYVALNKYPVSKKTPDKKIVLLQKNEQDSFYLMQGGVLSRTSKITPDTVYSADKKNYLLENKKSISVPLYHVSSEGINTKKIITFGVTLFKSSRNF